MLFKIVFLLNKFVCLSFRNQLHSVDYTNHTFCATGRRFFFETDIPYFVFLITRSQQCKIINSASGFFSNFTTVCTEIFRNTDRQSNKSSYKTNTCTYGFSGYILHDTYVQCKNAMFYSRLLPIKFTDPVARDHATLFARSV